jgi:hypothetical protein
MLTGTETRPKDIVAVPIDLAGMAGNEKKVGVRSTGLPYGMRHKGFLARMSPTSQILMRDTDGRKR